MLPGFALVVGDPDGGGGFVAVFGVRVFGAGGDECAVCKGCDCIGDEARCGVFDACVGDTPPALAAVVRKPNCGGFSLAGDFFSDGDKSIPDQGDLVYFFAGGGVLAVFASFFSWDKHSFPVFAVVVRKPACGCKTVDASLGPADGDKSLACLCDREHAVASGGAQLLVCDTAPAIAVVVGKPDCRVRRVFLQFDSDCHEPVFSGKSDCFDCLCAGFFDLGVGDTGPGEALVVRDPHDAIPGLIFFAPADSHNTAVF